MKKSNEYNIRLWLSFVNFKKAFSTLEINATISAMKNARKDQRTINLSKEMYSEATLKIRLHAQTKEEIVQKGVRQKDMISPKFFVPTLEDICEEFK